MRQEVNACGTCNCRCPQTMKMPQLQLWKARNGQAHATSQEIGCYPNLRSSNYFSIVITSHRMHKCTQMTDCHTRRTYIYEVPTTWSRDTVHHLTVTCIATASSWQWFHITQHFYLPLFRGFWDFTQGMGIQRDCTLRTTTQHTDTSTIYFVYNVTLNME